MAYYPKDKYGNKLLFRTSCDFVVDTAGVPVSEKLREIEESIDSIELPENIPDGILYDDNNKMIYLMSKGNVISRTEFTGLEGGSMMAPGNVTNVRISTKDGKIVIKWKDPNNVVVDDTIVSAWKGTKVVYKEGSYPEDPTDGVVVTDNLVRDRFAEDGLVISGLTNGTTYYIRLFPYAITGEVNTSDDNKFSAKPTKYVKYGFNISVSNTNPESKVTYIADATGKIPASMNFSTGVFNMGDWDNDEFFIPRPCMLKFDGTVDYYLNPNDYTKKIDGTKSDIDNPTYPGNAMMEWGRDGFKIWYKFDTPNKTNGNIFIANYQVDETYKCYPFIDCDGVVKDHFYTPIYNGSLIDGKLRSISGQNPLTGLPAQDDAYYAKNNNTNNREHWTTETFGERVLISILGILLTKSLDTQTSYGHGYCASNAPLRTGTMNKSGLFTGSIDGRSGVKFFGMENYWGNVRRRVCGLLVNGGVFKYKLTYGMEDGSSIQGYQFDSIGYLTGTTISKSGYISDMNFNANVGSLLPMEVRGSSSTGFADYFKYGTGINNYPAFGYARDIDDPNRYDYKSGLFAINANMGSFYTDNITGSSISYR